MRRIFQEGEGEGEGEGGLEGGGPGGAGDMTAEDQADGSSSTDRMKYDHLYMGDYWHHGTDGSDESFR